MYVVRRHVAVHVYLFDYDLLLLGYVLLAQERVEDHVAEDVHAERDILREDLHEIARELFRREAVERSSPALYLLLQAYGVARLRPLEEKMLDEMAYTVIRFTLVPHPCVYPYPDRDGLHVRHPHRRDLQAVIQIDTLKHHPAFLSIFNPKNHKTTH